MTPKETESWDRAQIERRLVECRADLEVVKYPMLRDRLLFLIRHLEDRLAGLSDPGDDPEEP